MLYSLDEAIIEECGGKAGTLGVLRRAGFRVPDGFVVPFSAYRVSLRGDEGAPVLSADLHESISHRLQEFDGQPVAVRSSASDEDGEDASAAGQYATVLGASDVESVSAAVRTCWLSLNADRARAYRQESRDRAGEKHVAMAVLVQRLINARVSGVMFAADSGRVARIEASWGLGTSVVNGTVNPDRYEVGDDEEVTRSIASKLTRVDRIGGILRTQPVLGSDQDAPALDDATALAIAGLGQRISTVRGSPQDIEWAIDDTGIWILQARPITAELPAPLSQSAPHSLQGMAGSSGVASGRARVVTGTVDFARVRAGDILVCPHTDPSWMPLLRVAAGVITETGGALSHAAIVARERRIPAVLGIPHATIRIPDSALTTIDGANGTVTIQEIE